MRVSFLTLLSQRGCVLLQPAHADGARSFRFNR